MSHPTDCPCCERYCAVQLDAFPHSQSANKCGMEGFQDRYPSKYYRANVAYFSSTDYGFTYDCTDSASDCSSNSHTGLMCSHITTADYDNLRAAATSDTYSSTSADPFGAFTNYSGAWTLSDQYTTSELKANAAIGLDVAETPASNEVGGDYVPAFLTLNVSETSSAAGSLTYRWRFKPSTTCAIKVSWGIRKVPTDDGTPAQDATIVTTGPNPDTLHDWTWSPPSVSGKCIPSGFDPDDESTWPVSSLFFEAVPDDVNTKKCIVGLKVECARE